MLFRTTIALLLASHCFGQLPYQIEQEQRAEIDSSSFLQDLSGAGAAASQSPGGSASFVTGNNNQAVFTLPGDGLAAGAVILNPCGLWTAHSHPRASEIIIVATGTVNIAFAEEEAVVVNGTSYGGRLLSFTAPQGTSVTIPQGLIHYVFNNNTCSEAQLISTFSNRDPGVVSVVSSLFALPQNVISASTGLSSDAVGLVTSDIGKSGAGLLGIDQTCQKGCSNPPQSAPSILAPAPSGSGTVSQQLGAPNTGSLVG